MHQLEDRDVSEMTIRLQPGYFKQLAGLVERLFGAHSSVRSGGGYR